MNFAINLHLSAISKRNFNYVKKVTSLGIKLVVQTQVLCCFMDIIVINMPSDI